MEETKERINKLIDGFRGVMKEHMQEPIEVLIACDAVEAAILANTDVKEAAIKQMYVKKTDDIIAMVKETREQFKNEPKKDA